MSEYTSRRGWFARLFAAFCGGWLWTRYSGAKAAAVTLQLPAPLPVVPVVTDDTVAGIVSYIYDSSTGMTVIRHLNVIVQRQTDTYTWSDTAAKSYSWCGGNLSTDEQG